MWNASLKKIVLSLNLCHLQTLEGGDSNNVWTLLLTARHIKFVLYNLYTNSHLNLYNLALAKITWNDKPLQILDYPKNNTFSYIYSSKIQIQQQTGNKCRLKGLKTEPKNWVFPKHSKLQGMRKLLFDNQNLQGKHCQELFLTKYVHNTRQINILGFAWWDHSKSLGFGTLI